MKILTSLLRSIFILILLCAAITVAAAAQQIFTNLANLSPATGSFPASPLIEGLDGNFYGSTTNGGAHNGGTFFRVTPSGTVTDVYDFDPCGNVGNNCLTGAVPSGQIAMGPEGNFYGTTRGVFEGAGYGTIYKITPAGSLTVLYNFSSCTSNCSAFPISGVTLGRNGDLCGVSFPPEDSLAFDNVVFEVSLSGTFTNILVVCPDQTRPADAGPSGTLLQATGGNLIGPGPGGANGAGAIYKMTSAGTPTVIYSFCADSTCHDGNQTTSPLVETANGEFYGTNAAGGSGGCSAAIENIPGGCGTAFKLTASGVLTKLHDFCAVTFFFYCVDGGVPSALIQATDGNFYGTANVGGSSNSGIVFRLRPDGTFIMVHQFHDGSGPVTALYQGTDGYLYGTTRLGGANDVGTVFRIWLGVAPFVRTVRGAGAIGAPVIIYGNNLTGSTSVTFNGTSTAFSVVSDTEITTTVPAGATTGSITVVTPSTTLTSNVAFKVLP